MFWLVSSRSDLTDDWGPSSAETTPKVAEEHSLVFSLKEILTPRYQNEAEANKFMDLLREVFPHAVSQQANSTYSPFKVEITEAIKEVFKEDKMETNDLLFEKVDMVLRYILDGLKS